MNIRARHIRRILSAFLAMLLLCWPFSAFAGENPAYPATWQAYMEENGIEEFTYNAVVDGITQVMEAAAKSYEASDADTALKQIADAKNVYWGGSGFKVQMQKKLPAIHKSSALADFKACTKTIKEGGSADDWKADRQTTSIRRRMS